MPSLQEICEYLKKEKIPYECSESVFNVETFCSLKKTKPHAIAWIKTENRIDVSQIRHAENMVFVLDKTCRDILQGHPHFILCNNSKEVYFSILNEFFLEKQTCVIEKDAVVCTKKIGNNVSIGHHCYISENVTIGNNVVIMNNVTIECPTVIGDGTIVSSGVVIGSAGFGYFQKDDLSYERVPHFGGVMIGKNVEIGANTCIDRGTLDDTIIGDNVKIDNLCHIAHNVEIEKNSLVIALSLLGGSSTVRENAYIAPGAIIKNQIEVGRNTIVGMGAVVTKDVNDDLVVAGVPAKPIQFSGKL